MMQFYAPDTRIADRYEILGYPMVGGMGIVYICNDLEQDLPVALKTFKPGYLPNRAARDRFLREGTHWVDLGVHPHIVRCYEVFKISGGDEVYLVLELVAREQGRDDTSLRAWLTPGQPLSVETALLFALQIARGMAHAAKAIPGFVHRDLKPENVLVGADKLPGWDVNRLRVTDLGLAAVLQEVEDESPLAIDCSQSAICNPLGRTQLTHGIVGTPLYMAPEQWRGETVGVYTDVYALGCVLYEMVVGQRAAAGRSLEDLQRAHCEGDLCSLPDGLSEGVCALLTRCLAREPGTRYAGWEEVEDALAKAYGQTARRAAPPASDPAELTRAERIQAGWSYNAMGMSYLDIGKTEVAAGYFQRAAVASRAEGDRLGESAALGNLGNAYRRLGEARRAIGYYEQALAILREIGVRRGEGNVLGNLGNAYNDLGETRRAVGYLEQALVITREIGDRREVGIALGNLGVAYLLLGDARRAIGYYEQALAILREIGVRRGEGNVLGNLGEAYRLLGEARRAIGCYEQSVAIAREIGDRHREGIDLGNLGVAYKNLGDTWRAIGYFEQALAVDREIGNIFDVARTSFNMALLYAKQQGEAARALELAKEAALCWPNNTSVL